MTYLNRILAGTAVLSLAALAATAPLQAQANEKAKDAPTRVAAATQAPATTPAKKAEAPKINRKSFGEWELECFDPKVNGLKCQVVQKLVSKDNNQLVLVVSVAHEPKSKKNLLQMALPLNFMLKPGVEIAIGNAKTVVQVDRCSAQGCFVEGVAGDDLVDAMVKGSKADVKFLANSKKRLIIPFSLKGFTKAYTTMKKRNAG
ncbi:MAG: invasion associated locus B family protein [Alphaproteobacteria bacterium]|nr:invasion associated locus B family protein [Alphaproteobacteria bacterium]